MGGLLIRHLGLRSASLRFGCFEEVQANAHQPQQKHDADDSQNDAFGGEPFEFFALFFTGIRIRCAFHCSS